MTIQQAIEKAIEGGYNPSFTGDLFWYIGYDSGKYRVFLDPLFWQSLGKAMGWHECRFIQCDEWGATCTCGRNENQGEAKSQWINEWHRFIDHLAEGKDAESYFREI